MIYIHLGGVVSLLRTKVIIVFEAPDRIQEEEMERSNNEEKKEHIFIKSSSRRLLRIIY